MSALSDLAVRLRALLFRRREDRELNEELQFHVEKEQEARARSGAAEPRREALANMRGVERVKDEVREARGIQPLDNLLGDIRYAFRALRRNPGFTVAVVAVLGIGIGAATTVFVVANRVLFSPLPYPDSERIVAVTHRNPVNDFWLTLSAVDILAVRDQQRSFEAFGALQPSNPSLTGLGTPRQIRGHRVTSGFFTAFGARAAEGRLLDARDDSLGTPPVAVASHAFASDALGGPANAVGRSIILDGVGHEIVGVLEPGVDRLAGIRSDVWPAFQIRPPTRRGPFGYRAYGRLRDGVSLADATSDLSEISRRIYPIWKAGFSDSLATLTPTRLRESIVGDAGKQVGMFGAAVALVLLVAIANVAILLLVRSSAREHEMSVRAAIGAGRPRLARLIVTECLALTAVSGVVAIVLSSFALRFVSVVAPNLPRLSEIKFDPGVVLFAVAASVMSGVLVSIVPVSSVLAGRTAASGSITSATRAGTSKRAGAIRGALVVTEFALVLPLLLGAGLLFNSFLRLTQIETGFDANGVYGVSIALPPSRYEEDSTVQEFWTRAEFLATQSPGVSTAGFAETLPPDSYGASNNFDLVDKPVAPGTSEHSSPWSTASNGFFATLKIPVVEGRLFLPTDSDSLSPGIIVSQAWAKRYYPEGSAVGKQLFSGGCRTCRPLSVVGVVGNVHYEGITGSHDAVYTPVGLGPPLSQTLLVKTRADARTALNALRGTVESLDGELVLGEVVMAQRVTDEFTDPKRRTAVVASFALVGVLLAALGIFGLMSFVVRERRRELGVRIALGARPDSMTQLIVRRGMRHALIGTVIGLGIAAFEARWIGSVLYGVQPTDPMMIAMAAIAMLFVAAVACWVPGLRAARIKPIEVLAGQ